MAKGFGLRLHKAFLNFVFNNNSDSLTTPNTDIFVSLHTADPGPTASTGANDEVSGGSYARENFSAWDAADDTGTMGWVDNTSAITFTQATGDWGTVTHAGLWTHTSTDTDAVYLGRGELTASKAVGNGDTFSIEAGDIDFQMDETA